MNKEAIKNRLDGDTLKEINKRLGDLLNKENILSPKQLQEKYGISRTTCWRWWKDGVITRVNKVGGKVYYIDPEKDFLSNQSK